jgi:NAD(P)-dependent dehydrogenase (short-subunit alcohol dehydrogenase family)
MNVALITGANKGLGFETARQLGQRGFTVLIGARDGARMRAAVDALQADGIDARPCQLDVTDQRSIDRAVAEIERDHGKLDVLINNAGVHAQRAAPSELLAENVAKTIDTNFMGAFRVLKACLPLLSRSAGGRVVNVSSVIGSPSRISDPEWEYFANALPSMAYSASKAALNVLTIAFARELADTPIKINAIDPGYTATDFNQFKGKKQPMESVRIIVRFATLPPDGPTGGFFDETGPIAW